MKAIILTFSGMDRTGVVARLAAIVQAHEGNWLESRMMRMGGSFSGMVRVSLPETQLSALGAEFADFMREIGYQYNIQSAGDGAMESGGSLAQMSLSGQDHPGIVRAIFKVFQQCGINVEELSTGLQAAPWSGTPVFEARASLRIPTGLKIAEIQKKLESIAEDLMVECAFNSP